MTPKITDQMADEALEAGGREKREVQPPPEAITPIPPAPEPAPQTDLEPLTGAIGELVESLRQQLISSQAALEAAQRQNNELQTLAQALMADKPVRFKPVRDMNRDSPTYLLVEYYDMIPVQYTKKTLN